MTRLYPNLCYNEARYEGTALYCVKQVVKALFECACTIMIEAKFLIFYLSLYLFPCFVLASS